MLLQSSNYFKLECDVHFLPLMIVGQRGFCSQVRFCYLGFCYIFLLKVDESGYDEFLFLCKKYSLFSNAYEILVYQ